MVHALSSFLPDVQLDPAAASPASAWDFLFSTVARTSFAVGGDEDGGDEGGGDGYGDAGDDQDDSLNSRPLVTTEDSDTRADQTGQDGEPVDQHSHQTGHGGEQDGQDILGQGDHKEQDNLGQMEHAGSTTPEAHSGSFHRVEMGDQPHGHVTLPALGGPDLRQPYAPGQPEDLQQIQALLQNTPHLRMSESSFHFDLSGLKMIKTAFLVTGGMCSKLFGLGMIGFLAFQSMQANLAKPKDSETHPRLSCSSPSCSSCTQ